MISSHIINYFKLIPKLIDKINFSQIEKVVSHLKKLKKIKEGFSLLVLEVAQAIVLMQLTILEKFVT